MTTLSQSKLTSIAQMEELMRTMPFGATLNVKGEIVKEIVETLIERVGRPDLEINFLVEEIPEGHFKLGFAPGVVTLLLFHKEEQEREVNGRYTFHIGDMDLATEASAHALLVEHGIDHVCPAGYLGFKTDQAMLLAIKVLREEGKIEIKNRWEETPTQ